MAIKNASSHLDSAGALGIADDAFHALRRAGAGAWSSYYAGSAPFLALFLLYWGDASHHVLSHGGLFRESILLAAAFVWMKTGQSVFAIRLREAVSGSPPTRWPPARLLRTCVRQALIQPSGIVVIPVALLLAIPFGRIMAFYQTATVMDDGRREPIREFLRRTMEMAGAEPKQNWILVWLLSPFLFLLAALMLGVGIPLIRALSPELGDYGLMILLVIYLNLLLPLSPAGVVVGVNLAALFIAVPMILQSVFGMDWIANAHPLALFNTRSLMILVMCAYLVLDPFFKGAYVLRVFQLESRSNGEDLLVRLRRHAAIRLKAGMAAVLMAGFLPFAPAALAGESVRSGSPEDTRRIPVSDFDRALDEELSGIEYRWQLPSKREKTESGPVTKAIQSGWEGMLEFLRPVGQWIKKVFNKIMEWRFWKSIGNYFEGGGSDNESGMNWLSVLLYSLSAILLALGGYLWFRRRKIRPESRPVVAASLAVAAPDIRDERVTADALPGEEWLALAGRLREQREWRLCLRALWLASLAGLGESRLLVLARHKSNREYELELSGRFPRGGEMPDRFGQLRRMVESSWYGFHEATEEAVQLAWKHVEWLGGRSL